MIISTSKDDVYKLVKENGIEFIRLQFTDIFGIIKSTSIMVDELDKAFAGELFFDGSSIDGFARIEESDQVIVPDPSTFKIMPWRPKEEGVARMICDVYAPDGKPFEGCPRYILKKAVREAEEMSYKLNIGPEGEFFLFYTDEKGYPTFDIHDNAGYFDLAPVDMGEDARRNIILTLKKMGFKIEASHHEVAPGQHEIDFKYDEALATADNWMTFRDVVKNVAKQFNLYATFMPKPFTGKNGNAMHCNQSLFSGDTDVFYDSDKADGLSDIALNYIGGLLKHARGMAPITNPIVNSYKRLKPGYEAPIHIAWSTSNRSTLIRIPAARGNSTRVELRNPDPTANPYLVFAVMLRAGLDGIKNEISPPAPQNGNMYTMHNEEIPLFPRDLQEAIVEMKKDPLIRETLGDHIYERYLDVKQKEWNEYAETVHNWEINRYLRKF
ncbi:type I glutamate--ammonia ligase [Desulfoscipio geothermicus]|uniref:Glutamine synthetase n=1 Tax=Desulfoscipio geothermicus DSM 3669 TaxID=1121426 RepID=A0A1I6DWJ5_9FIRM|nr:type I glutamate--ammonia ligase [Desulfoscipio geothermicus]SFR09711.1 L-glutamine synthetase [Desulfoscipio geothermicus DSM 3669]